MRVFLSEYLTCGAFDAQAELKASLAVEGGAMLRALAQDAIADGNDVSITWDPACGEFGVHGVTVHPAGNPFDESRLFRKLTSAADVTLVIAPEFDNILEERCRLIVACGGRSAGATAEAVALCADKLRLAEHLTSNGIPAINTAQCAWNGSRLAIDAPFPCVIKPRFGAGSLHAFVLTDADDLRVVQQELPESRMEFIGQPFVAGQSLSVAGIVSRGEIEMFPVCTQDIDGKRLEYTGGTVPAPNNRANLVRDLARRAIGSVRGLHGYVGVDLILPEDGVPIVVEINPRLTSSYHGYRKLATGNLATRILWPDESRVGLEWKQSPVTFGADGSSL